MNAPFLKPYVVNNANDLRRLAPVMKDAARADLVTEAPTYSDTEEEAKRKAVPLVEQIFSTGMTRILMFEDRIVVTVALSIDAYDDQSRWHLSMSMMGDTPSPARVPDKLATTIAENFFEEFTEGPAEGAFAAVRHFLSPHRPEHG